MSEIHVDKTSKVKKIIKKKLKSVHVGMTLVKVKEQDGIMLAKVKEQDGIDDACISQVPSIPTSAA